MGILKDKHYWAGVLNATHSISSQILEPELKAAKLSQLGCSAFSRLSDDKDLEDDFLEAQKLIIDPIKFRELETDKYIEFIHTFSVLEEMVLREAGLSEEALDHSIKAIQSMLLHSEEEYNVEQFREQIEQTKQVFCSGPDSLMQFEIVDDLSAKKPARRSSWEVTKRTVAGVSIFSANLSTGVASAVFLGPIGAAPSMVAGLSLGSGWRIWKDAWKGHW